ncbi:MAG TPA: branched-chain amino acid ABC transporter permease [Jiangellaceae bacterium]|nr:branched-chain amino acid ABC transporter permease [Jiangellaceae bacterium]
MARSLTLTGGTPQVRRLVVAVAGLLAALTVVVVGTGTAWGQEEESPESIRGFLRNDGEPVEGVTITVSGDDGEVGSAETDAEGAWEIPVPGPGSYEVVLDTETLPDDLPGVVSDTISTTVNPLQDKAVLFRIGEPGSDTGGEGGDTTNVPAEGSTETAQTSQIWQLIANGLRFGLILGLAALGLSLIFGTMGLTNFAHGELVTFGAIVAWFLNNAGLPVLAAAALAIVISGAFGWAQDYGFWGPLRRRGTGLVAMMIISIGVGLVLRYLYLYFFAGQRRSYNQFVVQRAIDFGPFGFAPRDLWIMIIAFAALALVALALIRTRIGKATRAVSDNPALAAASGIDVDRVITTVWIVGAALAGLAGVLFGLIQQVDYLLGFRVLLLVFAAVVLGGLGTAWGAMIGALIVGVFVEVSTLLIPSELKYAGVLAVLILILLVRPQGILGRRERIG